MELTHVAIWTTDLERLRTFYIRYFEGKSNEKYVNSLKGFASYFIQFEKGASLEIMQRTDIVESKEGNYTGLTHIAFYLGSREKVNAKIEQFRTEGYTITGEPRYTGDGFYEGALNDPDGNQIELVAYPEVEISRALFYPYDILLMADPEREKVDAYLSTSDCFVATSKGLTVGVIVVEKQSDTSAEIRNLAVDESFQRRGIARQLIRYVTDKWAPSQKLERLVIRTGTSAPGPFMLYQQEGFDLINVEYDYFPCHYREPIYENGVQCRHQLIMEKDLQGTSVESC